jgi:TetR/AcrR family transcriptional regulator, repressor for uid operon
MGLDTDIIADAPMAGTLANAPQPGSRVDQAGRGDVVSRFDRREAQIMRILDASRSCFLKSGFQGASMGEICTAAGMSPGALYRYFPSKESLIEAICAADKEADAIILAGIANAPSIIDGMTTGLLAHAKQMHESGLAPLFAEIFAEAMRNATLNTILERSTCEVHAIIGDAIKTAIERREIDPVLPLEHLLPIMMAMGEGLVTHDLPKAGVSIETMEPAVRAMIVGLLRPTQNPNHQTGVWTDEPDKPSLI